jgi:sugar phosphate isomerase/epimerase
MAITRRGFTSAALVALAFGPAEAAPRRRAPRVRFGIQTYSFRDMLPTPGDMVDKMIAGCRTVGLDMVELFEPTIQPPEFSAKAPWAMVGGKPTEASLLGRPPEGPPPAEVLENRKRIRKWRLETPMTYFEDVGRRFRRAGIEIQAYNFGLKDDCTDAEVERGFAITKALGTRVMTASTTLTMAQRTVPFAQRHKVYLGLHGHSNLHDPNQLATPDSFEKGLAMSPWYRINLDIGHFSAAGFDALAFLDKHADRIVSAHLKDRKNNDGPNMPLGEGDTPVAAFVRRVAERRLSIPLILEYEYAGGASVPQLARMLDYAKRSLTA